MTSRTLAPWVALVALAFAPACYIDLTDGGGGGEPPPGPTRPPEPADRPEPVLAEDPPPPPTGGTLAMAAEGAVALASDADRDVVWVLDVSPGELAEARAPIAELALGADALPGQLVELEPGRWLVVLRGEGALVEVLADPWRVGARHPICDAPWGLARDAMGVAWVACEEGQLVGLDGALEEVARFRLPADLRDVVPVGDVLFVSRLREASVLAVDRSGTVRSTMRPEPIAERRPNVAWRMVPDPARGGVLLTHQLSVAAEVPTNRTGYGAPAGDPVGAISQPALTHMAADGRVRTRPFQIGQAVLPLDLAAAPDGRVAVVATGSRGFVKARVYDAPFARETVGLGEDTPVPFSDGRQVLSIAFDGEGEAVVQTRAPWAVVTRFGPLTELPGVDRFDTGQALFHMDGGRGVACASCHPDGREDGHIWDFDLPGPRRTQTLRGGLRGSAPFHRDGAMRDFHELNRRTLGELMGAPTPFPDESEAMLRWLDTLPAVAPALQDDDAEAVARGRAVFEGAAGCADCHQGARLEDGERHHVGTGGPLDTPTLVGISRRLPWMADGCATSVDTFFADAVCRGERHGDFAGLRVEEERDLAAYLRSL